MLTLEGHGGPITDASFPLASEPSAFITSSEDGSVRLWDCRSGQAVQTYGMPPFAKEFATCHLGGRDDSFIAAAWKEQIVFWDRRSAGGLEVFEDAHSEDVTRLRFHPTRRTQLFTASVDALMCCFDTSKGATGKIE